MPDEQLVEQQEETFVPPSNEMLFDGAEEAVVAQDASGGGEGALKDDKGDEQQADADTKDDKPKNDEADDILDDKEKLELSDDDKEKSGIYHDLKKERTKRQDLESENESLKKQLAGGTDNKDEKGGEDDKKTFWDDPDKSVESLKANTAMEVHKANFKIYARFGKEKHGEEKFDAAFAEFGVLSKNDTTLFQKMSEADDPAEFIYQAGKQSIALKEIGDPAAFRVKIEEEVRAKIEAESKADKDKQAKDDGPPESLSTVSSKGVQDQKVINTSTAEDLYD